MSNKGVQRVPHAKRGWRKKRVAVALGCTDYAAVSAIAETNNISRSLWISNAIKVALAREFAESADWVE